MDDEGSDASGGKGTEGALNLLVFAESSNGMLR